ncbi:jhy protein homolog [Porphyrio hochstetteri]
MSKQDFPQGTLVQPDFQLELQQRVQENEGMYSIELDSDNLEDSLEIKLDKEETASDTNRYTAGLQKSVGDGRRQEPEDKYFELRYDPNWKNTEKGAQFLEAGKASPVAGGNNLEFVQKSFYLHSHGSPKEKQEEAKPQDPLSGLGTQLPSFHEPRVVSRKPFRLHTKGREQAGDCPSKDNPSTHGIKFSNPPQRAKEDFVKKNKQTLGLHSARKISYLQLHDRKQQMLQRQDAEAVFLGTITVGCRCKGSRVSQHHPTAVWRYFCLKHEGVQHIVSHGLLTVTDPKTIEEEPVQCVPPLQAVKMEPEDTRYLKVQQLKSPSFPIYHSTTSYTWSAPVRNRFDSTLLQDLSQAIEQGFNAEHQNMLSQKNKINFSLNLKGSDFPRNNSQQPPGRPAKPMANLHRHGLLPPIQAAPMYTAKQDNSSAPQKGLYSHPPVCPNANMSRNSDAWLSNRPNLRCLGNQDFTTSACPSHLTLHKLNPPEMRFPAHTNKENEKHRRGFPSRLPPLCQGSCNPVMMQLSAAEHGSNGHTHLNWWNKSSNYIAAFQEPVQDQGSLQGCKRCTYMDKMCQYSPIISSCSPTVSRTTSSTTRTMEQHRQDIPCLPEPPSADRQVFSLLPPVLPPIRSGSEVNPESSKGNQVAVNQNNSEGFPMQREKQTQSKAGRKSRCSKAYTNLNVNLGGLGPDYEAIKEKKKKLKQQKEYAKQVQERNMKDTALCQWVDKKPKVVPPTSRQKAKKTASVLKVSSNGECQKGKTLKALEYAKKIPKPKNSKARQLNGEVKQKRVLPRTLNGESLPEIAPLETLQRRHEKEKKVVAAFKKLEVL